MERRAALDQPNVLNLLSQVSSPADPAYGALVALLRDHLEALAAGKPYFPVSLLRESCRRLRAGVPLTELSLTLLLRAEADAVLASMAANPIADVSTLGTVLRHVTASLDKQDEQQALFLRFCHIAGLQPEELPSGSLRASADALAARLEPVLAGIDRSLEKSMDAQNLKPRGEITRILENVRDGGKSLLDAVGEYRPQLRPIARELLRLEGRAISMSTDDLVHEAAVRMSGVAEAPLNHLMLEKLARRIMRRVLSDRGRRRIPGSGRTKRELVEAQVGPAGQSTTSAFGGGPLGALLRDEVLFVAAGVVAEIARLNRRPYEAEIVRARLFENTPLGELARIHRVSLSTVRRLMGEAMDIFLDRYCGGRAA